MRRFFSKLLARFKFIAFGYVMAAFAAGAAILGGASLLAVSHILTEKGGGVAPVSNSFVALFFLTAIISLAAALPAFILAVIAEIMKIRHWSAYVVGGAALTFVTSRGLHAFQGTADFLFFIAAGMLAGAVYWRIAGRNAGGWPDKLQHEKDDAFEEEELRPPQT